MVEGRKVAVVFPGQGSQSFEMLAGYAGHPSVGAALREAGDVVGCDFVGMVEGGDDALNLTVNTQPVMLAMGVGVFRAAMESGLFVDGDSVVAMAGHSLGEYAALVCSGSLDFADAVRVVRRRGEVMQDAGGAMAAAVGMDGVVADRVCLELQGQGLKVWAANFNTPQQTVIAGLGEDLARAEDAFKSAGAKRFVGLQMSCASHCPLMKDAAAELAAELENISLTIPTVKVVHNVSAAVADGGDDVMDLLRRHLIEPVRWVDSVLAIAAMGVGVVYECGPGRVLAQMHKRIAPDVEVVALASSADLDSLAASL